MNILNEYNIFITMDNDTKEKVLRVVEKVTGKRIDDIGIQGDLKTQLSLDSIQIVELFAALEKELDIELPLRLMTVKTGKAFLEILGDELKKQPGRRASDE
jgi:acyl carrier protein